MNKQLYIKPIDKNYFNKPNLHLFISTVFNNFSELYDFPKLNHNKQEINRLLFSANFTGFLVLYNGHIIGYLLGENIIYDNEQIFFINYIYVSPIFRNKKLGGKLLDYVKKHTIKNNYNKILLICDSENINNLNFYKKHNFILNNKIYTRHYLYSWINK